MKFEQLPVTHTFFFLIAGGGDYNPTTAKTGSQEETELTTNLNAEGPASVLLLLLLSI